MVTPITTEWTGHAVALPEQSQSRHDSHSKQSKALHKL
jgi:hypothetical protein